MANGIDPTQPKKFTYTLDIRGVDEEVLFNSPDGWLKTNIKYARSKTYGGLLRSLTLPLKFVLKGAYLLRREFYTYGLLAKVNIIINKLNPINWRYGLFYLGKIDFSKFIDDQVTNVTVNAIEKDITIQIDAYDSTPYAIPLNVTAAVDVRLTPLQLGEIADFIVNTTPDFRSDAFFQVSIAQNQQLGINPSVQNTGFLAQRPGQFTPTQANFFYIARTNTKVRINSPLLPDGTVDPNGIQTSCNSGRFQFNIYKSDGTLVKTLYETPVLGVTTQQNFGFDFSLNVNTGDRLFFYILRTAGTINSFQGVNIQTGTFAMTYFTSSPPTHCKGLRASYIYDYLINIMNGPENIPVVTRSVLLTTTFKNLVITCSNSILTSQLDTLYQAGDDLQIGGSYLVLGGSVTYVLPNGTTHLYHINNTFTAIVGYPTFTTAIDQDGFVRQISVNPQIILSFRDFFQSIYSLMCGQCALGLDQGVLCLEELSYFYRTGTKTIDLGDNVVTNSFKLEPNLDFAFNTIDIGYNDQQYDAINGSQEVNSKQTYITLLTNPINKLNAISAIRADPYGIEGIRTIPGYGNVPSGQVNTSYVNSAASKSNNDAWFIYLKDNLETGQTYYQPLTVAEGCISYSGIDASYYNWKISPKQNLLRGGNFLASVFDKMKGYTIFLSSALKNTNMVTVDLTGKRVAEGEPINISDLGQQLFLPYYATIATGLEFNAQELIDVSPYGLIWFMYEGVQYKGFINEISIDGGQNSAQSFKLLISPDFKTSDMIKF